MNKPPDTGEIIVVADAGMLSAANLLALEQAGFRFIVGSKISKAPYDLADHLERHGNAFDDGQTPYQPKDTGRGTHHGRRDRRSPQRAVRERAFAGGDGLGAVHHGVDRLDVVAVAGEP